ncbi:MepB family protein [Apibacter raozihei]|uniref:MepB family protein n=1 Tax=Apibacter raozihei TaxID=2500547 RepID=UPI000FE3CFC8|nr:MepB family protein [Apibacter raozihei]
MDNKHNKEKNRTFIPKELPINLELAIKHLYAESGMKITQYPVRENESLEYNACRFSIKNKNVLFREGKTTPTKIGQFVTCWKRLSDIILPFDSNDDIEFLIIGSADKDNVGQFIFDKNILIKKGIMSNEDNKGKTAFRIYPPWTFPTSKQAIKTQKWQLQFFVDFTNKNIPIDKEKVISLFQT